MILNFYYKVYPHKSNTSCHLPFKMASLLSFEDGEANVPSDISLENSVQSVQKLVEFFINQDAIPVIQTYSGA